MAVITIKSVERMRDPDSSVEINRIDSMADQLAYEMFATEPTSNDDNDLKHELVAAYHLRHSLSALMDGILDIPKGIKDNPDQLEDWLLATVAKCTYREVGIYPITPAASGDPTILMLESELAMHGDSSPQIPGMHRWGEV